MAADEFPSEVHASPDWIVGVFATDTRIWVEEKTFTVDFVRRNPAEPAHAELVARVALTESAIARLTNQIEDAWSEYSGRDAPWDEKRFPSEPDDQ
jgi:hypothetical protein